MKDYKILVKTSALILLLMMFGCNEYDSPTSPWEHVQNDPALIPEITQVLPEEAGSASEITIIGNNFASGVENNCVYFNNIQADIKYASENEIVVYRPNIAGDSIVIKVTSAAKVGTGVYDKIYKMNNIIEDFGILRATDAITGMCIDKDENMYVGLSSRSEVIKFLPDGRPDALFAPVSGSWTRFITDMKTGPEGYVYVARKNERFYRFPLDGGSSEIYFKFDVKAKYFDFDENGNIYLGGEETGIVLLKSDKTVENLGIYDSFDIESIRVFNNSLYVAAIYVGEDSAANPSGIYKNTINPTDGHLGEKTLVLDWALTGEYQYSSMKYIVISEEGDIYVGTDHVDPILHLKPGGDIAPLYYRLLEPVVAQLVWGIGNYLYLLKDRRVTVDAGGKFIRIDMDKRGAPYYGREL